MNVEPYESPDLKLEPGTFSHFLSSHVCNVDYRASGDRVPCVTRFDIVQLGSVSVFRHEGRGGRRGYRRLDHIRADRVDEFFISVPIRGSLTIHQAGAEVSAESGSFTILSTSEPFAAFMAPEKHGSRFEEHIVCISGPLLRARIPRIDAYHFKSVRITPGAGNIMTSLCALALMESEALSPSQALTFGGMLVDSIANTISEAPELLELNPRPRQSVHAHIRQEAERYIDVNVANPLLCPATIAANCKCTVSFLREAFASNAVPLGKFIREKRLLRCRDALKDMDAREATISEIAMKWGFNDPAYFSRAYKARFGKSPRDDVP